MQRDIDEEFIELIIWDKIENWYRNFPNYHDLSSNAMKFNGFGYLEGKINFDVWKTTQLFILEAQDLHRKIDNLNRLKREIPEYKIPMLNAHSDNIKDLSLEDIDTIDSAILKRIKEIITAHEKYIFAFDKIKDTLIDIEEIAL